MNICVPTSIVPLYNGYYNNFIIRITRYYLTSITHNFTNNYSTASHICSDIPKGDYKSSEEVGSGSLRSALILMVRFICPRLRGV